MLWLEGRSAHPQDELAKHPRGRIFVYDLAVPVQQGTVCPDLIRFFSVNTGVPAGRRKICKSATPDSSCQCGGHPWGQEDSDMNVLVSILAQTSVIAPDVIVVLVVVTRAAPGGANGSDLQITGS